VEVSRKHFSSARDAFQEVLIITKNHQIFVVWANAQIELSRLILDFVRLLGFTQTFNSEKEKKDSLQLLSDVERFCKEVRDCNIPSVQEKFRKISEEILNSIPGIINRIKNNITKEEKRAVYLAMLSDVGSGVGSFGGHWYTCPNGHVYTIGECGGANQESVCPDCGARVGGSNHQRLPGNNVAQQFLDEVL